VLTMTHIKRYVSLHHKVWDCIKALAAAEERSTASMVRALIAEAIRARKGKE